MRHIPRIVLAGLSGGAGKTITTLGLCRAWTRQNRKVRPFKKGPDYIDAKWLSHAARAEATNLDPYLIPEDVLLTLFHERMTGFDVAVVEGNRGIFDGKDLTGSLSTSELCRTLCAPCVLCIDATKMTRTAAAIIHGINTFEDGFTINGVILNRTAGPRHRAILRDTIEHYTGVPVLGTLPKLKENPIPERHMGLWSDQEMQRPDSMLDVVADVMLENLDLDGLYEIATSAPPMQEPETPLWNVDTAPSASISNGIASVAAQEQITEQTISELPDRPTIPTIGVVRDAALWFYYPENIEALERAGAEIVYLSILDDKPWPELHGLYLGGGFPEIHAKAISDNIAKREHIKSLSEAGMPIYAECGGFMLLASELEYQGLTYEMSGVFPVTTQLCARPQGLGYIAAQVKRENPFHAVGTTLNGHEFHYSHCISDKAVTDDLVFSLNLTRGTGITSGKDGLLVNRTFASYAHIHALGAPQWAGRFVAACKEYMEE